MDNNQKNLLSRAMHLLSMPHTEYQAIEQENSVHTKVLTRYVLPLLAIPFTFAFIGGVIMCGGGYGWSYDFWETLWSVFSISLLLALHQVFLLFGGIYITSLIINSMAGKFGGQKDFSRAFALVAYSYTPMFLAGIFHVWNGFSWLFFAVGSYGLYLLVAGLKPMMKPADEKANSYSTISWIVAVAIFVVLMKMLAEMMSPSAFSMSSIPFFPGMF